MSKTLFLIFNHEITSLQQEDAKHSLGVEKIVDLPNDLKELWRQVPPDLPEIISYLGPIKSWLKSQASKNDYVLIQGDFGASYIMVNFAFEKGFIPIYSTTSREAVEEYGRDGSVKVVHNFKHQIFRKYGV
ncbi:MAG: hypothetical protein JRJ86_11795 [Deltaproteobacteria bacterium]|nr:hypothetical protein [Deltaproteobacteria bacterium]MBW2034172.1 hypothetical protein [Deltaproteobacteria bacterium]